MGKILLFKIRNETIKETEQVLLKLVERSIIDEERIFKHHVFDVEIIISYLLRAGLSKNPLIRDFTLHRIEEVYACIQTYGYEIFVDKNNFKGIPRAFHNKPLVNPEIANENKNSLPTIWDITLFQAVFKNGTGYNTQEYQTKVTHILNYLLNENYQKLPLGYGIQCSHRNTYHAVGWSVHLPIYKNRECYQHSALLYYADLLSQYPSAIHSDWFEDVFTVLEQYKTGNGRYLFPKAFIPEKKHRYYVGGGHMGLGENRREKKSYEIESTYWMLKIRQNIQNAA